jgi:hypothetical protein
MLIYGTYINAVLDKQMRLFNQKPVMAHARFIQFLMSTLRIIRRTLYVTVPVWLILLATQIYLNWGIHAGV